MNLLKLKVQCQNIDIIVLHWHIVSYHLYKYYLIIYFNSIVFLPHLMNTNNVRYYNAVSKIQYDSEMLMIFWHHWFIFLIDLYYNVCHHKFHGNEEVLIFIKECLGLFRVVSGQWKLSDYFIGAQNHRFMTQSRNSYVAKIRINNVVARGRTSWVCHSLGDC